MLVDLKLDRSDCFMIQRQVNGDTTITIPLDVLSRAFAAYQSNQAHFDAAAEQERRPQ